MTNDENKLRQALAKDAEHAANNWTNCILHDVKFHGSDFIEARRFGFIAGTNSRDDLICKLVEALEWYSQNVWNEAHATRSKNALAKLYKELDVKS